MTVVGVVGSHGVVYARAVPDAIEPRPPNDRDALSRLRRGLTGFAIGWQQFWQGYWQSPPGA